VKSGVKISTFALCALAEPFSLARLYVNQGEPDAPKADETVEVELYVRNQVRNKFALFGQRKASGGN